MFYLGNKKVVFFLGLITTLCKWVGVPLLEVYEVLLIDPPIYPFLVRKSSTSLGKRRPSNACNSRVTTGFDDEDPLSGELVEIYLETVHNKIWSDYDDFTLVPPKTSLEVEILGRQLCQEKRKGMERDLMIF